MFYPVTYPCLKITVSTELTERVSDVLLGLGSTGIETRDHSTLLSIDQGKSVLIAWFELEGSAREVAEKLPEILSPQTVDVELQHVEDPGWKEAWREYFRPMRFGRRLWIAPFDEDPPKEKISDDSCVIRLVPAGAFGTGTHESTAMMLELLDTLVEPDASVLDVGCGTGVLCFAALKLGARSARGVDIDPDAIENALENAEKNGLDSSCQLETTEIAQINETYDIVLANLSYPVLSKEKAHLAAFVKPGGLLLWSGILLTDLKDLGSPPGMTLRHELRKGEWVGQAWQAPERS